MCVVILVCLMCHWWWEQLSWMQHCLLGRYQYRDTWYCPANCEDHITKHLKSQIHDTDLFLGVCYIWILMSCQPHRVTSGQSDSVNFCVCGYFRTILIYVKSFLFDSEIHKINPYVNMKQNILQYTLLSSSDTSILCLLSECMCSLGQRSFLMLRCLSGTVSLAKLYH